MSFDAASGVGSGADVDHRKKRRNRTTHSCINCHTTKRKCDRKRPCGRCTQLGLTGLCVYEVDDPTVADDPNADELSKLRKRIAELEGVIRELKNKPHPKWATQTTPDTHASFHTRSAHPHAHHSSLGKRRKLHDDDDDDLHDSLPGPSNVKLEGGGGFGNGSGDYALDIDGRYTLPDSFRMHDGFSSRSGESSPRHSLSSPVACECLSHDSAFQQLASLDLYLRDAISVLATLRHSPQSESTPTSPVSERCALVHELARLQDLIAQSTRAAHISSMPSMRHQSPIAPGRGPLTVQVPHSFQASIGQGLPPTFNLRPPPPPPSAGPPGLSYDHGSPYSPVGNGMLTPPLSSTSSNANPWDGSPLLGDHQIHPAPPQQQQQQQQQQQLMGSPALSAASGTSRSSASGANTVPSLSMPVPAGLEREAVSSLVGMYASHQSPAFFGPNTTTSVPFDFEMTPNATSSSPFDFGGPYQLRAAAY